MDDHERVISLSLEAIAEPSLWPRALLSFADTANCLEATVIRYNTATSRLSFALIGGRIINTEDLGPFLSYYGRLDPMRRVFESLPSGAIATSHEALSANTFNTNEFIQEYLLPLGGRYYGGWNFSAPNTRDVVGIALHSRDRPVDSRALVHLSTLANHLSRAIGLSIRFAEASAASTCLKDALRQMGTAYVLVDSDSHILDVSDEAAADLEEGLYIRIDHRSRLIAVYSDDAMRLRSLITEAAQGSRGGILCFATNRRGTSPILQVSPCGVRGQNPFHSTFSQCALVLIRRPAVAALEPGRIRSALKCSIAEAEVAAALASGQTPIQIAANRAVSVNTVRSQIRALLSISGTSRITDLVKLILSFG